MLDDKLKYKFINILEGIGISKKNQLQRPNSTTNRDETSYKMNHGGGRDKIKSEDTYFLTSQNLNINFKIVFNILELK